MGIHTGTSPFEIALSNRLCVALLSRLPARACQQYIYCAQTARPYVRGDKQFQQPAHDSLTRAVSH
jgi:hypothetical protein